MRVALKLGIASTLAVTALALACGAACLLRIPPVHGWMLAHHCPLAMGGMSRMQSKTPPEASGAGEVRLVHVVESVPL